MNRRKFAEVAGLATIASLFPTGADSQGSTSQGSTAAKVTILLPDSARVYNIGNGEARILVGAEQSAGEWWLASLLSEAGRKTSLHVHFNADEQIYVLEGVLSAWVEGRWKDLPAGALAMLPRRIPHALGNRSKQPVTYLASGNPAGFERFFSDIETLARRFPYGSPEFLAELTKLYVKYDSRLLGPPPEG